MLQSGHGGTDGRTDGQSETNIPPTTLLLEGYNYDWKIVPEMGTNSKSIGIIWWQVSFHKSQIYPELSPDL